MTTRAERKKIKVKKMNTKIITIAGIIGMLLTATTVFAVPTDFTLDWSAGSGIVTGTFNSGDDAKAQMWANGNTVGTFKATDYGDNPYTYGVDTTEAYMKGDIAAGGNLEFKYTRTDSYVSMYGIAGQLSDSFVSSTGTGSLDFWTHSEYAGLGNHEYGFGVPNFQATGNTVAIDTDSNGIADASFVITHTLVSNWVSPPVPDNFGRVQIIGTSTGASAVVDHMNDDAGSTAFNFGAGGGCYTNADITATGSGTAIVQGHGNTHLADDTFWTPSEWSMPNGGSYTSIWSYLSGLSVTDYAFNGN